MTVACTAAIYAPPVLSTSHFIPIVGVGERGAHSLVHGDLSRQHPLLELP